jgi:hypothetical protein
MTAPIFYTIAQPTADAPPFLLSVYRERPRNLHGIRETGKPGTASVLRARCTGKFFLRTQADAAAAMATAVWEKHAHTVDRATAALDTATKSRAAELRRRITALPGHNAAR